MNTLQKIAGAIWFFLFNLIFGRPIKRIFGSFHASSGTSGSPGTSSSTTPTPALPVVTANVAAPPKSSNSTPTVLKNG